MLLLRVKCGGPGLVLTDRDTGEVIARVTVVDRDGRARGSVGVGVEAPEKVRVGRERKGKEQGDGVSQDGVNRQTRR